MPKLGVTSKLYRNTNTYGSPTWTEVTCISDLAVNAAWDEADASSRASRVKQQSKTMMGLEITGKAKVSDTDAGFLAIWAALHSDTPLDCLVLNGAKDSNGVRGYRCEFNVFSGNEDQAMANTPYLDFTLKPAASDNFAAYVVVSAGAPVLTTITGA